MSKCYKCEAELSGSGKFCPECGAPQEVAVPLSGERLSGISLSGESCTFTLGISGGETLFNDRFTIESRIGSGGFGEVYVAGDRDASNRVALKIVSAVEGEEATAAEQLRNEITLYRKINNFEHIIRPFDIYVDPDYKGLPLVLLSMEYAEGGSLRDWIRENINSIDQEDQRIEALRYFKEACLGVKAIHNEGLIHLDLKPENLLITNDRVKVSDLGLSRNYIQYVQNKEGILEEFSTPSYMSPEQFRSARQKDINYLSDIYTLGIILFELLDGHVPFDGAFDELKEKHLSYAPPSLDGPLAPWGRIVGRCLLKNPSKRYPSVEELLQDLERAEAGDVLSVDVACKCGHINVNKDLKKCEQCNQDISHLFRRCPNCQKMNRLDVEVCGDCPFKVGRYFRVQDFLEQANRLRDVAPEEAIKRLLAVLKLEGGNREAKEMLPGLREIQEQIREIIPEAEKVQKEGRLEDSRSKWQDILKLAPRHRVATQKKKELYELIVAYNNNYDRAFTLMDQGEFSKARNLLNDCREMIPTRKETDSAFKEFNVREQQYNQSLEKARTEERVKHLSAASSELGLCLQQSRKCKEVLELKRKVDDDIETSERLYDNAAGFLEGAEFERAAKNIELIKNLRTDFEGIDELFKELNKKSKKYQKLKKNWEKAYSPEVKDLLLAEKELKKGLTLCPDAKDADKLLKQVRSDKKIANKLIKDAEPDILAADFGDASKKLDKARSIWPLAPDLTEVIKNLENIRKAYENHFNKATNSHQEEKDLDAALIYVSSALKLCPDSKDANDLEIKIAEDQKRAKDQLKKVPSLLPKADFEEANKCIKRTEGLWPKAPKLSRTRKDLQQTCKSYEDHISKATHFREKDKDLDAALKQVKSAIEVCPESDVAESLRNGIEEDRKNVKKLIASTVNFLDKAKFDEAEAFIKEALNIWVAAPNLKKIEKEAQSKKISYTEFYGRAKSLVEQNANLNEALRSAKSALEVCPGSVAAKELWKKIDSEIRNRERAKGKLRNNILMAVALFFGFALIVLLIMQIDFESERTSTQEKLTDTVRREKEEPDSDTYAKSKGQLFVNAEPSTARIKVLNIEAKYRKGIELWPGRYQIEVSETDYQTVRKWVTVESRKRVVLKIALKEIPRFVNNGDGTISDRKMGLMWERSVTGDCVNWRKVNKFILKWNTNGYYGYHNWRLPTIDELRTLLVSEKTNGLFLNPIFEESGCDIRGLSLWSSSISAPGERWATDFRDRRARSVRKHHWAWLKVVRSYK